MSRFLLLFVLSAATCLFAAGIRQANAQVQATDAAPAAHRLTAHAFISATLARDATDAQAAFVSKTIAAALPRDRFASITVSDDKTLAEAQAAALTAGAEVVLYVRAMPPQPMQFQQRFGDNRFGRDVPIYALRTPLALDLYIRNGQRWKRDQRLRLTSADVPGAERDAFRSLEDDLYENWGQALRVLVPAACEQALLKAFLPHTTIRAVKAEPNDPPDEAPALAEGEFPDAPEDPPTEVQIELTNRSHCQVADATVTIEQYNDSRKRWEAMDQPRLRFFRRPGEPEPKPLVWEVAGSVDAGHVVLTDSITLNDRVLRAVERRQCRLVLHAAPVVRSLPPSRRPHPLVKDDEPVQAATP